MGIATTRILTLITATTTFPHLHRRTAASFHLFRRRCLASNFHSHSHSPRLNSNSVLPTTTTPLPWPEWSHFVDRVSALGFESRNEVHLDDFVGSFRLSDAFLNDAVAFLAFARQHPQLLWSLPREDIEVVIENVSPSLFKDADDTTSRMRSFLVGGANYALESDKPSTVDLMKFLLSYVHVGIVSLEEVHISSKVESSVRNLFSELGKSRGTSPESVASEHTQFPEGFRLAPRSSGNNIEMKRGDWVCTRCSFMNFAKNKNCLQCEELRPRKILSGGEWECPQCDFLNFSRNVVCLRCDCKKPEVNPLQSPTNVTGLGVNISSFKSNTEKPFAESEGKQQPWFTKISQLEKSSDLNTSVTDGDFSKFMPAGDNRVSLRSSNQNAGISQNLGELLGQQSPASYTSNTDGESEENKSVTGENFTEIMPMGTGGNRFVVSKRKDRSLTSPVYKRQAALDQAGGTNHVPFVPFPSDYFAQSNPDSTFANSRSNVTSANQRKLTNSLEESKTMGQTPQSSSDNVNVASQRIDALNPDLGKRGERNGHKTSNSRDVSQNMGQISKSGSDMPWRGRSLEGSAVKEPDPLDMSEEAKAERWFKRVAQIKDISELTQIPDEDFPSIMPLRKGVNRFVVSKRKTPLERRLTSSQYRRNLPAVNSEPDHDRNGTEQDNCIKRRTG